MNNRASTKPANRPWLPGTTAALAFLLCNGTFILVGLLSLFGISLTINPHLQAALISLFALLTLIFVYSGYRMQQRPGPLILAGIGALLVIGTMYISFYKAVETVGLILLISAAIWNWRASKP